MSLKIVPDTFGKSRDVKWLIIDSMFYSKPFLDSWSLENKSGTNLDEYFIIILCPLNK